MIVAITGASGFLGQHLVSSLKSKKIKYRLLDRSQHDLLKPDSLESLVKGADFVIHLAAINRGDNLQLMEVNLLGTASLLEAIRQFAPSAKLIFSSTFQVYLNSGLYSLSKKLAEQLITTYARDYSLKATILRFSNLYGPQGKPFYNSVISTFVHQIKTNQPLSINGSGQQSRDYLYVSDAVSAILQTINYNQTKPVEVFDICTGHSTPLKKIVNHLQKIAPQKVVVNYNRSAKESVWSIFKTPAKAAKVLHWKPQVSLTEGLTKTFRS